MSVNRMKLPLFDEYWIEMRQGTKRHWYTPEFFSYCPSGPYASLMYDAERKKYRLFSEELLDPADDNVRVLMLRESDDLIHFSEVLADDGTPYLFMGGTGIHGAAVTFDPHDPDPSRRYKMAGMTNMGNRKSGKNPVTPVILSFSPDGIHWTAHPELVANSQISDTKNNLFYNPYTEEYHLLHRAAYVDRRVCVRTSSDLSHWSDPRVILYPGTNYNDEHTSMQHYALSAGFYDGIFYGLLWRYNTCLYGNDFTRMFGYMEPELVYSYDGQEFLYSSGKSLVERPFAPAPGCCGLSPQDICESADGKNYYVLCRGQNFIHGTEDNNIRMKNMLSEKKIPCGSGVLYQIRKDGFCGIESVDRGGTVITKCIQLLKDDLEFNVRANCGSVRFALLKKDGSFFDGFSFDDCVPFEFDDDVAVKPIWKEHQLSEVVEQELRIGVELNTAILHCITATARPHIRQAMKSFADPSGFAFPPDYKFKWYAKK